MFWNSVLRSVCCEDVLRLREEVYEFCMSGLINSSTVTSTSHQYHWLALDEIIWSSSVSPCYSDGQSWTGPHISRKFLITSLHLETNPTAQQRNIGDEMHQHHATPTSDAEKCHFFAYRSTCNLFRGQPFQPIYQHSSKELAQSERFLGQNFRRNFLVQEAWHNSW